MRLTNGRDNLPTATAIRPTRKVLFVSIEANRLHGPDALVEAREGVSPRLSWITFPEN